MADLVTVARALLAPGLTGMNPARLATLITTASAIAEGICKREFTSASRTVTLNGDGDSELLLPNFPVTAVTTVTVIGWDDTETEIAGSQFRIQEDIGLIRFKPDSSATYRYFPQGFQNLAVVYVSGFDPIPADLQEAVVNIILWIAAAQESDPTLKSERLGDWAGTFITGTDQLPISITLVLSRFKDRRV